MKLQTKLLIFVFSAYVFLLCISTSVQAQKISTPEEIKAEFSSVPCKNDERLKAVKSLFERMGASSSEISVEKYNDVENLVVIKKGTSTDKIIIGAHYDKTSDGCGAIDNWTGIVALAHLYSTIKTISLNKTIVFVAFGKEEKGLLGSRAMVEKIDKEQVKQYCSMVNVDSLGLAAPQVLDNVSSKKLLELTESIAKEMKIGFNHATIQGADADSSSFLAKKIPAVTIHGLSNQLWSIIHKDKDKASTVNHNSVYLGYRLALALVVRLDSSACDAYK